MGQPCIWSSTGDTPRRSARLSEKTKAVVAPPSQAPKKKQKKSSTKGPQEKSNTDEDITTDEKDANAMETKEPAENSTKDAKDVIDGEANTKEALPEKPNTEEMEEKTETETIIEEPSATAPVDKNINACVEQSNDATIITADVKTEETPTELPRVKIDEPKKASAEVPDAKNDEPKGVPVAEKGTTYGKVGSSATVVDQNNPEEKQAAGNPDEKDNVLQVPTTSS